MPSVPSCCIPARLCTAWRDALRVPDLRSPRSWLSAFTTVAYSRCRLYSQPEEEGEEAAEEDAALRSALSWINEASRIAACSRTEGFLFSA